MGMLCYSLDQIPDLSLNKYQSLADTGIEGVLKRHENFLRQWHGICSESNTSIHLLYAYIPTDPIGMRLKIFLLLQGNQNNLEMVDPLLQKSPLSDFFELHRSEVPVLKLNAGATFTKKERVADIFNPMTGRTKAIHYVPKWQMNDTARQYDLFRIMETICHAYTPEEPCAFRIDVFPVTAAQETRDAFNPVLKDLRGENDLKLVKETESLKSDDYARDVCKEYEDWITSIETCPHFRVNIYSFASTVFHAKVLLNAAGAEALSEGDFSTAQIKTDQDGMFNLFSRMEQGCQDYCFFPNASALKSWSTTYTLNEVLPFFRFPALYDGENIGISKETDPVQFGEGVYFGKDTNGYPVYFPLKDLPKHAFFTGMPGSGKTNTMLHLVTQLKKHNIPFLALEPAKKEYRALLGSDEMQDVHLFSPHLRSHFPLQVNPMEFPVGVRLSEHINALLEVFQGSFVLEGPTYKFLGSAIQKSYTDLGWDVEDVNTSDCELPYPTLQNVYDNLQHEIDASSYDSEFKGNLRAFLQVRLGGLMERDAGELFNAPFSTIIPGKWIETSAIVELEVLGEQAKNFFILLVCHYILESLRANPSGGVDSNGKPLPVRHVLFIEEAHNIIAPSTHQSSSDSVDPKISATAYIVKMLAEVRALREAIVIADQLPTALASEVTKNTGLKLVHRLTAQDDREQIGSAISASPVQLEQMASFSAGCAYMYHEKTMRPFELQVAKWESPNTSFDYTDDVQLYSRVCRNPVVVDAIINYMTCWKAKYLFPLDDQVFDIQKQYLQTSKYTEKDIHSALINWACLFNKLEREKRFWLSVPNHDELISIEFEEISDYVNDLFCRLNDIKEKRGN